MHVYTHIRLCISFAEAQLLTVRPSKGGGSFETGGGHLNLVKSPYLTCWRYGLQFRLLSVINTTRRHVWKDRDDVKLLVNGSQYLSHALVNLSAFVNVLSYEVHAI